MEVGNSNVQQTQQAAPQENQGQRQEVQAPNAAPTIEEVMEGLRGPDALDPAREAQEQEHQRKLADIDYQPEGEIGKDPADENAFNPQKFEAIKREEAKLWEQKQQLKKEREEIERMRQEAQDERGSFETHLDDLLRDPEERDAQESNSDDEYEYVDPEEFEKRILDRLEAKKEEERSNQEISQQAEDYKASVNTFAEENIDRFPLMASLKRSDMVWDSLEQTYDHFAEKYGEEKAAELVDGLSMEQVVGHVEKKLASEMESLLQYDSVRSYLSQQLGKKPSESQSQDQSYSSRQSKGQSQTLTNSTMSQDSGDFQNIDELSEDEALRAVSKLIQRG